MPSSNSQLDRLLSRYETLVKTASHLGHQVFHVETMFPKLRAFAVQVGHLEGPERLALVSKVNRWLGFLQGWLWSRGLVSVEELADETRGVDQCWRLHGSGVQVPNA